MNKKVSIIAFVVMIIVLTACMTILGYLIGSSDYDVLTKNVIISIFNITCVFIICIVYGELKDIISKD